MTSTPTPMTETSELRELRDTVRRFLTERSPISEVRRLMDDPVGFDPKTWSRLAGDLGLTAIAVPQRYGGAGYGFPELAVVCAEMGRHLYGGPFLASAVLACGALLTAGDEGAAADLLPALAAGESIGTLALAEDAGRFDADGIRATARRTGEGWRLSGHKAFVLDGHAADLLLVAARSAAGISLFAVRADAPGLVRTPCPTLDQTRRLARLTFDDSPARLIGTDGGAWAGLSAALDRAAVALAAEQAGAARFCVETTVGYAKVRHQFGRPIGGFQAIRHRCADLHLAAESAGAAAEYAAWAVEHSPGEAPAVASLAKAVCSDAYFRVAAEMIQIHGGIGFTWEHDAHLHFKRATASAAYLGSVTEHRELLADRIGI